MEKDTDKEGFPLEFFTHLLVGAAVVVFIFSVLYRINKECNQRAQVVFRTTGDVTKVFNDFLPRLKSAPNVWVYDSVCFKDGDTVVFKADIDYTKKRLGELQTLDKTLGIKDDETIEIKVGKFPLCSD